MTAYGYIRKSVIHDGVPTLSPETQEASIRALAARNGDTEVVILSDLDRSGKLNRSRRPGWDALLHAIEDGQAHAVYAYSLSRFARSMKQLAEFAELCADKKVKFRCDRDAIDTSNATGKLFFHVLSALAQFESDVTSERVKDAFAAKRISDPSWEGPGNLPYGGMLGEDAQVVLDAFRQEGSFDAAARALYLQKVPTRNERNVWHGTTVADIIRRVAPDEVGPATGRGVKAGTHRFRLSRLLVCGQCRTIMTPSLGRGDLVRYYCREGRVTPHGRSWVTEPRLLPLIAKEMERAALIVTRLQKGKPEDETKLAALDMKRTRVIDTYTDGVIDKVERDRRLSDIADQESKLSARRSILRITMPPKDIERSDEGKVNAYLRQLLTGIVIEDMKRPAKRGPSKEVPDLHFEWRDESMRSEFAA